MMRLLIISVPRYRCTDAWIAQQSDDVGVLVADAVGEPLVRDSARPSEPGPDTFETVH